MPTYSYYCENCDEVIEKFSSIREYKDKVKCDFCKEYCGRYYSIDIITQFTSIKKSDSELKTLGDLANRNRDRLSKDQRQALDEKHNSYKEQPSDKELPTGMSRMKKPKTVKWRTKK